MSDRFLLVRPLRKGDLLSDLILSLDEYGAGLGCRFILMVGETAGEEGPALESTSADNERPPESPPTPVDPHTIARRQAGAAIFLAHPEFPTNDDLAAIRVEAGKMDKKAGRALVVNSSYGEVETMISLGNPTLSIYSTYDSEDDSAVEKVRREIFKKNAPGVRQLAMSALLTLEENQNLELLVLVDPRPGDFETFGRHVRHGGLLMLVSTNGAPPDRPETLADKLTAITPCVLSYYRRVEPDHAQEQ